MPSTLKKSLLIASLNVSFELCIVYIYRYQRAKRISYARCFIVKNRSSPPKTTAVDFLDCIAVDSIFNRLLYILTVSAII